MRKLILLLCLCLCLNVASLAEEEYSEPMDSPAQEESVVEPVSKSDEAEPAGETANGDEKGVESAVQNEETAISENADKVIDGSAADSGEGEPETESSGETPIEDARVDYPADEGNLQTDSFEGIRFEGVEDIDVETGIPSDAQAWFLSNDIPYGGSLSEVIAMLQGNETVYLLTSRTIHVSGAPLDILSEVSFKPDPDVFGSGYAVRLYNADPEAGGEVFDFSGISSGERGDVWFYVESKDAAPQETETEADSEEACTISVTPNAFAEGEWVNMAPVFLLSGIPEDEDNMIYAVIKYDSRIIPLSSSSYIPTEDGVYTLQFVIQNGLGDFADVSERIDVWFDWTKPKVNIAASKTQNYTITIQATDALSGVAALSIDGGKTWTDALDGATYTYTASSKVTLPAGQIQVMDQAGNIYKSEQSYELTTVQSSSTQKSSSSTSSTSSTTSNGTSSHATAEDDSAAYGVFSLKLPEEPMRQLIINDTPMALTLMLQSEDISTPISFTGNFEQWYLADGSGILSEQPNTLMLEAVLDDVGDIFSCRWSVNGEVFKELYSAGIDYVVFKAMDDVFAVPTAGFIGGTKYTELKMSGVSTKKFDYALTMNVNRDINTITALTENDLSEDCDFSLSVTVEDISYQLSDSEKSPMYYYDVYLGSEAMMQYPFGKYDGE